MSTLVRTQIFLTTEQRRRLHTWSKVARKNASELIRDAINDHYVRRPTPEEAEAALRASFGSWKGRRRPSAAIVRALRRGRRRKQALI
jgi:Arc/MetJ-type ribon-helix-helix transcriptional regulator